ncbi:amino acid transporter [Streptomyces griseochromogenes]|uniref:Amino acid permease n=1 Tax=Streptomyces griseochromogenes TaxID=68214 RepID=A0A1B1B4F9_9ACTN|nr:APC family permease [Streptomyces griseochromogenes]ANP53708.1 amino acid permease [Streptomyces griseochromogenes]MBP2055000.1 amino acid transporter [Streptomyces griseochromogenes]
MAKVDQAAPVATSDTGGLRRDVGLIGLMWASVGSIIGSGWLYGAEKAVVVAGPAAIISWVIGAVAIVLLALVHAELGGMFPVAGGTARYPHYAFGGLAGMSFGWFAWLQAATVAPIEVEAMIGYAGHWKWAQGLQHADGTLTVSGIVTAVVLMAVFVGVNFFGVRALAHTNSAATWWKIAVPLGAIFIIAATNFHGSNFTSEGFAPFGAKGILGAISSSGIIFALLGFEQAIQLAGESRNPKRDLPRATLGSVAIGAVIYILLQVVFIGALPHASFAHGWAKLDFVGISGPWAGLATLVGLGWLGWVLYVDAIISPAGTGLIYTTATSRVSYGLAKNGYAPKAFSKTDKRGVPWFGLIMSFVTGVVCFLPFPSWQELVGFITSASVLMYAGAPLAYGVFADRLPNFERPYRLPFGKLISPLSFVVANLIIYWAGWNTLWRLGFAILLGYLLLGSYAWWANATNKPDAPRMDFKAAQWLPAYLLGIGLISWQGGFGDGSQGNIPLWWDILVVAAFSLGIYYWAKAVASKPEAIERSIEEVVVTDAPAH